jgi:hypothetical protein
MRIIGKMLLTTEVNDCKMHMKTYSKRELMSDNFPQLIAANLAGGQLERWRI